MIDLPTFYLLTPFFGNPDDALSVNTKQDWCSYVFMCFCVCAYVCVYLYVCVCVKTLKNLQRS